MLFDIQTLQWDPDILELLQIPVSMLPLPVPSSGVCGMTDPSYLGGAIPIEMCIRDSSGSGACIQVLLGVEGHAEEKNQNGGRTMSVISMKQLLEAGVHFGHQTRRWNPKMAEYIYTERNGIYIIDLQKSVGKDVYKRQVQR